MQQKAKKYQAIFWDNDGVLVDTEKLFFEANRRVLQKFGVTLTWARFAEISLGRGGSILELAGQPLAEYDQLVEHRNEVYSEILRNTPSAALLRPGVLEVLHYFHGHLIMGIVSSCRRCHFNLIHRRTGIPALMDFILLLEDCPVNKPHPDPYLQAMARCHLSPEQCVVVEDAERGIAAARAAGIDALAVPENAADGSGNFSQARAVISSLTELPEYIGF